MNIPLDIQNYKQSRIIKREVMRMEKDKAELLAAITDAKQELDNAAININFVSDPMLLDHYTFKVKAAEARYRYLMCQAREMGIENDEYRQKMYNERFTDWKG